MKDVGKIKKEITRDDVIEKAKIERNNRQADLESNLPARIRRAIQDKKITQKKLAEDLGYNVNQVSKYINEDEKQRQMPPLVFIKDVADYLNVPITSFFYNVEEVEARNKANGKITYRQLAEFLLNLLDQSESRFVLEEDVDDKTIFEEPAVDEIGLSINHFRIDRMNLHIYHPEIVKLLTNRRTIKSVDGLSDEIYTQWREAALSKVSEKAVTKWDELQEYGFKNVFRGRLDSLTTSDVWSVIEHSNPDQEPGQYLKDISLTIRAIDEPF